MKNSVRRRNFQRKLISHGKTFDNNKKYLSTKEETINWVKKKKLFFDCFHRRRKIFPFFKFSYCKIEAKAIFLV